MLDYMQAGNEAAAGEVMAAHIGRSMQNILRSFRGARTEQKNKSAEG